VLAHLYLASACVWRFRAEEAEAPVLLPLARAAIQAQLQAGAQALEGFHANMPQRSARLLGRLTARRAPAEAVSDECWLELAESLEHEPMLLARLLPDLQRPATGGLLDLMEALELAQRLGPEAQTLQKRWRQTRSMTAACQGARDPVLAKAYLQAVDRVIQVDDGPGPREERRPGYNRVNPYAVSSPSAHAAPAPSNRPPERTTPQPVPAK